jgi:hypothetical protein
MDMFEFVLSQTTMGGILISLALTTTSGLLVYAAAYKLIYRYQTRDLKDPTSNLFRVVGTLVSLMLSLAFADVVVDLREIEKAIEREVVTIADAYNDLYRYDVEATREARGLLMDYAQAVIDDDWPALANNVLGEHATKLRRQYEESVWKLEPATPVQEHLRSQLLAGIDKMFDYRVVRLDNALAEPPIYLYTIIFGFLVTMACFGAYQPQGPLLVLVSLYTVFVGAVLYLILALSDPFQGDTGIEPTSLELLVEAMRSHNGN